MKQETGPSIRFNDINVGSIDINSGVFVGNNQQCSWNAHEKTNAGLGTIQGTNIVYQPIDIVFDQDLSDHHYNVGK